MNADEGAEHLDNLITAAGKHAVEGYRVDDESSNGSWTKCDDSSSLRRMRAPGSSPRSAYEAVGVPGG